jgi:hypothetical protein
MRLATFLVAIQDKQSAIDQAVAVSIATDEPFEGERAAVGSLLVGDYVTWVVDGETLTGEIYSVDGETAQVKIYEDMGGFFVESVLISTVPVADLTRIAEPEVFGDEDELDERAVNQDAPAYMRAAARRGLEYYADGLAGDGLVDRTVDEARQMADGTVSDDKWIRIAAWIARHLGDLDSPDADPSSDNYPSAGVVAHLLWGSGPSKRAAERTLAYAESVVARIRADEERETMTADVRSKWVDVAFRIKAQLEGGESEGRSTTSKSSAFTLPILRFAKPLMACRLLVMLPFSIRTLSRCHSSSVLRLALSSVRCSRAMRSNCCGITMLVSRWHLFAVARCA